MFLYLQEEEVLEDEEEEEEEPQHRNDAENDVDTISLPPHAAPEERGGIDNDGVSYISAITNPTHYHG